MSGLARYIQVLRLYDEAHGEWTIADMAAALDVPGSTVYRTVRDMVGGGLLEAANEAQYRLGPCFIEFDRLIRVTDPLYAAGTPLLRDVVMQARVPCVAVLARLYNGLVMCVADASTPGSAVRTSYERGRPRPLTRGATSKAILAQLSPRKLARILSQAPELGDGFAVRTPEAFREELATIRKRGFAITRGEVDRGLIGIAAPIALPSRGLVGSLSLVLEAAAVDSAVERRLGLLVASTASLMVEEVALVPQRQPASLVEAATQEPRIKTKNREKHQ